MTKYGIRSVFCHESKSDQYTYYSEVTYDSLEDVMEAINSDRGEEIAQASTIDNKNEEELVDYWLDEIEPYEISEQQEGK
jgi:hypothetical protein